MGRPQRSTLESIATPARYGNPALSPDERHVAVDLFHPATGKPDIWVIDVPGGVPSRFTVEGMDTMPLWSADSSHIVFRNRRSLKMKASSGAGGDDCCYPKGHISARRSPGREMNSSSTTSQILGRAWTCGPCR